MSGGWQRNATTSFIQTYERLERYWYERLVCLVRRTSSQISPPLTRTTACLFLATCLLITRTLCLCTVFVDFDLTFNYGSSTCMRIRLKFLWQMEKHSPPLTVVLAARLVEPVYYYLSNCVQISCLVLRHDSIRQEPNSLAFHQPDFHRSHDIGEYRRFKGLWRISFGVWYGPVHASLVSYCMGRYSTVTWSIRTESSS